MHRDRDKKKFDLSTKKIEGRTAGKGAYYLDEGRDGRKRGNIVLNSGTPKEKQVTYQCKKCLEIYSGTGGFKECPKCRELNEPPKKLKLKQFGEV